MERCCGTCRPAQEETGGWLTCHRYPPTVPVVTGEYGRALGGYDTQLGQVLTGFPVVDAPELCGEWKRRQEEKHGDD